MEEQTTLFDIPKDWETEWQGMPEYSNKRIEPYKTLIVNFVTREDYLDFVNVMEQPMTSQTKYIYFPEAIKNDNEQYRWGDDGTGKNPKYPFYIISKGRAQSRLTAKTLESIGVPYSIIVEEQEYYEYKEVVKSPNNVLVLPKKYLDEYDTFDKDDSSGRSTGPGAARNFAWQHSIDSGVDKHWVLDDNILGFFRYHNNRKIKISSGTMIRCLEDFVDRYENVALAGLQYEKFCKRNDGQPPYITNTRIYSCLLIRNDLPYRWRGRYNEDTDLSLRALKDKWCTLEFNALLQGKVVTQAMQGGNTEEFYNNEGTMNKSKMLEEMHPDVAKVVWKFSRWHHEVDYSFFKKNKLKLKEGLHINNCPDNSGMILTRGENHDNKRTD